MDAGAPVRSARVRAQAKLNLGLRVAALRGDGYHEIDTLFARIDVCDELLVRSEADPDLDPASSDGIGGAVRTETPSGANAAPPMQEDNLAWRAARAWRERSGTQVRIDIELDKRIPVAAGLGGGSADAAAVLRALRALHGPEPEPERTERTLGSDVPFLAGEAAAARCRGRGERCRPRDLPQRHVVIVNDGIAVAAAAAYGALGGFGPPLDWDAVVAALQAGEAPRWRNDLQAGVLRGHPEIRRGLSELAEAGLQAPLLAGSGGSVFALATSEAQAHEAAASLRRGQATRFVQVARIGVPAAPVLLGD